LNILITGSSGFIAKNLIATLKSMDQHQLFYISRESSIKDLKTAIKSADFLFHLAGINRPKDLIEFYEGNRDFTNCIVEELTTINRSIPIVFSSSAQVFLGNDYGNSKRQAEEILEKYAKSNNSRLSIYRLPGVFGKWSKPEYNSVVSTFCHRIANGLEIQIHEGTKVVDLVYIDDVVGYFLYELNQTVKETVYPTVNPVYAVSLDELANTIRSFDSSKERLFISNLSDHFHKKLFATYTSFLPIRRSKDVLKTHQTENSSFAELLKSNSFGQVSLNTIEAGAVRGNHWHHTKHEKFLVIQGKGVIRMRNLFSDEVILINVSAERLEWIEILPGYVHNIENIGTTPLMTVMWASEIYDSSKPDTFSEDV
jgi:UDP-2-acetamido-2,6-beta-L-arabino-hexul-4-ose reductase